MNPFFERFKDYIRQNPVNYGCINFNSLFEMFYWYYMEMNPNVNDRIWALYGQIEAVCKKLTVTELDELYTITGQLYAEMEMQAFRSGLRVGMQWMLELLGPDSDVSSIDQAQ